MNLNFEFQKAFGIVYTEKILEQCGGRGTDPHAIENSYKYIYIYIYIYNINIST